MVHDTAQIRRQAAKDFMAHYDIACARQDSMPLPAVTMNLDNNVLDFNGDRVKLADWQPILDSIAINKHLHHIAISSTYQAGLGSRDTDIRYYKSSLRKKIPAICSKDLVFKLCKVLRECLTISPSLKTLHLNGLPLRERDLVTLTKGLASSASLENLSLANCPISDKGLEVICQSVKYSASIRTVDFTGCNLTWRGAEHMANIIKHQGMQRHGSAWPETLRYRQPQFESMGGLRRVTLNRNSLIGDRGAAALAQELAEDLWVKAVDLQKCGLSSEGARHLLEALKTNSTLCVLDIRCNPLVDKVLIKTVLERVLMNTSGQTTEYCWIKPPAAEPKRTSGQRRRVLASGVRGKAAFRTAVKGPSAPQPQKHYPCSGSVPWRTAARAGRQRGLPPGVSALDQSFQVAATVKVTMESDSEEEEQIEEEELVLEDEQRPSSHSAPEGITSRQFQRTQVELRECRLRLAEERRDRMKAESRLMEYELEVSHLRSTNLSLSEALAASGSASAAPAAPSALEDDAVLESIEKSFTKFHAFLDLLKDAGLGQLASIAGIDQSDFQPVGKPQLSSTLGQQLDVEGTPSGSGEEYRSAGGLAPPAPSGLAHIAPLRCPTSGKESLHEDKLLDVTLNHAAGHALDRNDGEEKPDQHFKPDSLPDLGSEHYFHSQNSFRQGDLSKASDKYVTHHSDDHSHQRDGSHGYSFRFSSRDRSGPSCSSGSRSDASIRSSICELLSDKAESVGSSGSKHRVRGLHVVVGHSGSEGSGGKSYSRQENVARIRSVVSPGGYSDDESF
ncbi:centrosomal protein of 78 kDa [Genypterus blacodes]|uniref:centrosomal protein of 78 kDa n=1 Tax=Genypterus blacodes TaxID=154954 RepID=UPI003F761F2F